MGNRDPHHKILIPQQQFEFSPFGPHYAGHNELTIAERIKTFNRQLSILTKKSFNLYSDFDARLLLRFVYDPPSAVSVVNDFDGNDPQSS